MHRAFCRAIRGKCPKWRESDAPAAIGEEVRQKENKKQNFDHPKYSFSDALGLSTGLVLAYSLTQQKRLQNQQHPSLRNAVSETTKFASQCPFGIKTSARLQPIFSITPIVNSAHSSRPTRKSIDVTPFLQEEHSIFSNTDINLKQPQTQIIDDEDDGIVFDENPRLFTKIRTSESDDFANVDKDVVALTRAISSDIFSVLGAYKFLTNGKKSTENPPFDAIELLQKGAEFGSSRALYNIGVAYDRLNDQALAKEYYKKAAALGHPLATYNYAIFKFREGKISDGFALLKYAAENGVAEAQEYVKKM